MDLLSLNKLAADEEGLLRRSRFLLLHLGSCDEGASKDEAFLPLISELPSDEGSNL